MNGMQLLSMGDEDSSHQEEMLDEGYVFVFDRRQINGKSVKISLGGLFNYQEFRSKIKKVCYCRNVIVRQQMAYSMAAKVHAEKQSILHFLIIG